MTSMRSALCLIAAAMLFQLTSPVAEAAFMMEIRDLIVGEGRVVRQGYTIKAHYTGWLEDGTEFDSSWRRNNPLEFQIGVGNVIPGWDFGLEGMKTGGVRHLRIPARLAYGSGGSPQGGIPPNATLIFEVELIEIVAPLPQIEVLTRPVIAPSSIPTLN